MGIKRYGRSPFNPGKIIEINISRELAIKRAKYIIKNLHKREKNKLFNIN